MILNNYKILQSWGTPAETLTYKNINGTDKTLTTNVGYDRLRSICQVDSSNSINSCTGTGTSGQGYVTQQVNLICGSGNTAATESDYYLETPLSLTYVGTNITVLKNNNVPVGRNLQKIWSNNTGSPVTVSEVGALIRTSSSTSGGNIVMIERTVLENPVTLANGDTITVSLKIMF